MKSKRIKNILLIAALSIISVTAYIMLNKTKTSDSSDNSSNVYPITKSLGTLNITVDPRIELLTAVQQQAGYDVMTKMDFTYKEDMMNYFKPYKALKAVKDFSYMRNTGYSYDAPPTSMLYLSNPPELNKKSNFSDDLIKRASGKQKLNRFVDDLGEFSQQSDFCDFYNKNIPFYQTITDRVYTDIKDMPLTKALDDYYGMEVNSYNIILSPMLHSGGYGPRVKGENGLYDLYAIIGPETVKEEETKDILPVFSTDTIQYLVWHEFSHSFVNPSTEKYRDEINEYQILFSKIRETMNSQSYSNWETCVNEHIVRAVTVRLSYQYLGKTAGDNALSSEKACGFYYIEALCKSLEVYENNRDTYPTFESYYPQLIKVFKDLSEQDLPESFFQSDFTGPINSAFSNMDSMNIAIIIPTKEESKSTQNKISEYVSIIKEKAFPKAEIIEDTKALDRDLSNYIIVAYGTIEGNLWLKHYQDKFPFQINSDTIVADKDYQGTNLRFITGLPNPQNAQNPLVIYTAQKAEDVININSVNHGSTDYIITKDLEEITSGNYVKEKDNWHFSN